MRNEFLASPFLSFGMKVCPFKICPEFPNGIAGPVA